MTKAIRNRCVQLSLALAMTTLFFSSRVSCAVDHALTFGVGTMSCMKYLNVVTTTSFNDDFEIQWVLGFISALSWQANNIENGDNLNMRLDEKDITAVSLRSALVATCMNNPAMNIKTAAASLYRQLSQ